jgi:hypothetical protein
VPAGDNHPVATAFAATRPRDPLLEQPSSEIGFSRTERASQDFARRPGQRALGDTLPAHQFLNLWKQKDLHAVTLAQSAI